MHEPVNYVCTNCGAEDRDSGASNDQPQALICWKCKAGSKMNPSDQLMRGIGMLPKAIAEQVAVAQQNHR